MADEAKKFLDAEMEKPKSKQLIIKNIALGFVVFVILLLCVLAWFTSQPTAEASGLTVKTEGDKGLEVSLDGGTTWSTQWGSDEGWTKWDGLNKFSATNGGSLMRLLSGNGQNLYYPINVNKNGEASHFQKVSDEDAGDYCFEFEAYFRSSTPATVSLSSESSVLPFDANDNTRFNNYGFSPDNIAGASRVAFLKKTGTTLTKSGLWIPNPKYELLNESGTEVEYTKLPDNFGGEVTVTQGGNPTPVDGTSSYYLWTPETEALPQNYDFAQSAKVLADMKAHPMIKLDDGTYYCQFYTVTPQERRVEQPFTINSDKASWQTNLDKFNCIIDRNTIHQTISWSLGDHKYRVNIADSVGYEFYHFDHAETSESVSRQLVRVTYNPTTGVVKLLDPDKSDVIISSDQGTGKLNIGEKIVVTKTVNDSIRGMDFDLGAVDPGFNNGTSSSCDYEVVAIDRDPSNENVRRYKLKSTNGKYLAVSGNTLTLVEEQSAASYFYIFINPKFKDGDITDKLLGYIDYSVTTPAVKYIVWNGSGKFTLTFAIPTVDRYIIYRKSEKAVDSCSFNQNGNPEENYTCWGGENVITLGSSDYKTAPQDLTNLISLNKKEKIGEKEYYTGKLIVRIYAEGYDREAKKPLEKGKIKVHLQFKAAFSS